MSVNESEQSPSSGEAAVRTLDDYLAHALPQLTKRERRRLVARGGVTINGVEVREVEGALGDQDVVGLPPAPGGTRWAETPPAPPVPPARPSPSARAVPAAPPTSSRSPQPPRKLPERPTQPAPRQDRAETPPRPRLDPRKAPVPRATGPAAREIREEPPEQTAEDVFASTAHGAGKEGVRGAKKFLARGVRLVHEDDEIIVVDKSPGIVTADPTHKTPHTVFDIVKDFIKKRGKTSGRGKTRTGRVWVIHRLDKEASGLLVFAKSEPAFMSLKDNFRAKRTDRVYYAVVEGVVGPPGHMGTHQSFLVEGDELRVKSIAASEFRGAPGKEARLAVTHYKVVAAAEHVLSGTGASLLQVRLETGRKNQIRAHMADLKHPIVGDRRYGSISDPFERVALHAAELGFTHPRTGLSIRFSSPPPGPFYRLVGSKPLHSDIDVSPADRVTPMTPARETPGATRVAGGERDTSWDRVAGWYDDLISEKRNDHYEDVILPGTLRLMEPQAGMRVLDVACGQGVLSRRLAEQGVNVVGVDAAPQLIAAAKARGIGETKSRNVGALEYHVGDARDVSAISAAGFDAAACVMALGNIDPLVPVFKGVAAALKDGGTFTFVIAHPSFRAPGQTYWGWDNSASRQYRRVDGYLSAGQKAIQMHPGKDASIVTWSFHRPLQAYIKALADAGFVVDRLEEWPGMRMSTSGPRAAEENRIRREIPLFLAIRGRKAGKGEGRN